MVAMQMTKRIVKRQSSIKIEREHMTEISRIQQEYGCNYSTAAKLETICKYIKETSEELQDILKKQDSGDLEIYWLTYFIAQSAISIQSEKSSNLKKCKDCNAFRNGCEFSETETNGINVGEYVACGQFVKQ